MPVQLYLAEDASHAASLAGDSQHCSMRPCAALASQPSATCPGEPSLPVTPMAAALHEQRLCQGETDSSLRPGLQVIDIGSRTSTVVWHIDNVSAKLRHSRGFPLLSPHFSLASLSDVRVMFAPGAEWLDLGKSAPGRTQRRRRQEGSGLVQTFGAVKVKASDASTSDLALRFELFIGSSSSRTGPLVACNFSERSVQSCDLDVDWRKHAEGSNQCLTLRLEFSW